MTEYYVFYVDDEIETSYDYESDLAGTEDEITVFEGTLEECLKYKEEHEKEYEKFGGLDIQDGLGFGVW